MSDSVRPHRWQPTRLPCPWDTQGTNTGVGCHFLLQCIRVKSESEVAQSCLTLSNSMDGSPPDSSIHGIFQARVLEWGALFLNIFDDCGFLEKAVRESGTILKSFYVFVQHSFLLQYFTEWVHWVRTCASYWEPIGEKPTIFFSRSLKGGGFCLAAGQKGRNFFLKLYMYIVS